MRHERTYRLENVDAEGFFPMAFATEGEASDGDILSIKGGQIPKRFSLLEDHDNSAGKKVGSVDQPEKDLSHTPPRALGRGQIELDGHGDRVDNRRDLAHMINKHGGAVSVRWDEVDGGVPPKRRVNLPSDHPHFVADDDPSGRKRSGWFWESWKVLEVSVVALGADGAATIGGRTYVRKDGSEEFELQADDARQEPESPLDLAGHFAQKRADQLKALEDEEIAGTPSRSTILENIAKQSEYLRAIGVPAPDLINAVTLESDGEDFEPVTIGDEEIFLPQRLADQLADEREERAETKAQEPAPDPEPARVVADQRPEQTLGITELPEGISARDVIGLFERMLGEHEGNIIRRAHDLIDERTGKVKP